MLLGLATSGLWRVIWYSLALALFVGGFSAGLRALDLGWVTIRRVLIGIYGVGYVAWFAINGIIIDRISVLWSFAIFLGVASVGKPWRAWRRTAIDLGLFVGMWLAYDESRGIADGVGMPIQVESVRNIDRFLLFGNDGPVVLQERFLSSTGIVRWYDVIASCVYYSHFIVPPVVLGILWWRNHDEWVRYMRRFATVIFIACSMFVLLPTAPPWMAAGGSDKPEFQYDVLPPLRRPTGNGWRHLGLDSFVEAWDTGRDWANEVAAMPSLHSAYALFVVVFFWPKIRPIWLRPVLLAYPAIMAVALMYFGEHYLTDALAGWATVGVAFLVWNRIEARSAARDAVTGEADHIAGDAEAADSDVVVPAADECQVDVTTEASADDGAVPAR
ncbi:MAG: phosphatase PAP2 family protein [Ilumatobacter sp.]|uniref:phosphatase PAP2 family protein n=1 Tax=Ilumatobacter sp. TaxID=1967498 RepID=UPI003C708850